MILHLAIATTVDVNKLPKLSFPFNISGSKFPDYWVNLSTHSL